MADNVAITAGSGTDVATDQVTGTLEHVQLFKQAIATDGSRTLIPADATNGLLVDVSRIQAALPAGTNQIGTVNISDGTNTLVIDTAHGDAESTNENHIDVAAKAMLFNGTSWDRARGDITNGLDVDVTRLRPDGTNQMPAMDAAARRGYVQITDGTTSVSVASTGALEVAGDTAHDSADAGPPVKVGAKAIAHGTNPTAVAAADRTDLYANRAGVLFTIGGHPNTVTIKHTDITTAVTDAAIVTIAAGLKIVVTRLSVTLDSASTVFPLVRIGFGGTNTPTTTGVLASHGGVPAGGGFTIGDGSGILGVGADGEDLRVTTTGNATGNGLQITVSYFTIES